MSKKLQTLKRVFRMGSVSLADIAPDLKPEESVRLYAANFPHLADCTLNEPRVEGDMLIYEVAKPPIKSKG